MSETLPAADHLTGMGRDEMNFAEFPLATLADRAPRGCKTLSFEDRVWDRSQGEHRTRRLTISASDKYGLPTAIDDEVIVGLVQVSKAGGFAQRRLRFTRYQLLQVLGWRDEGRSYQRLEQSLKRWLGVTLYYENAWWDKARKRWVDANFHLLDELVLYRRTKRGGNDGESAASWFAWNEIVFRSFQAGFLKKLDLDIYHQLKRAAAKRMYRFLDKRFHFSKSLRFDLSTFACEHIGLSRRYDVAQLKRRLKPAIAELEQVEYLVPVPEKERFHRLRRGEWQVHFVRAAKPLKEACFAGRKPTLADRLVERGVTATAAENLVAQYPAGRIEDKIAVFDSLRRKNDRRISQNPAGFLVQSIREDYLPPVGLQEKEVGSVLRQHGKEDGRAISVPSPKPRVHVCDEKANARREYLSRLSDSQRRTLEAEALKRARRVPAEGYRRALTAGNDQLAQYYREVMVDQYLSEMFDIDSVNAGNRVP